MNKVYVRLPGFLQTLWVKLWCFVYYNIYPIGRKQYLPKGKTSAFDDFNNQCTLLNTYHCDYLNYWRNGIVGEVTGGK